jgi:DNA-binding transcriptional ArsR family regulator
MYKFARFLQVICGATVKSTATGKPPTRDAWALTYLEKVDAVNFETGKSTIEIAKATGYKRASMSQTLNALAEKGLVRQERRGKRIKYFLSSAAGA